MEQPTVTSITRSEALSFRVRAQQLDRESGALADTAVLDIGVQDTGTGGARWALANRGLDVAALPAEDLVGAWTIRGAPHLYRRDSLPRIAAAVEPFSEADAGKRIYDAARPLKAAGIGMIEALDAVASIMASVVTSPMVKGEVSARVTALVDPPYLRFCRACDATHLYEMPFRLAALRAGLELEAGTSPPVLRPVPDFARATGTVKQGAQYDVVRAYLRLLGPAAPKHVASYLDAPVKDVKARWPGDAFQVLVEGEQRWLLPAEAGEHAFEQVSTTRLLGPYDLFLQARDRSLLVDDPARAKALWPVLGRPGAILLNGEIAGIWRPRQSGKSLRLHVEPWTDFSTGDRAAITEQAQRLAAHRQSSLSGIEMDGSMA